MNLKNGMLSDTMQIQKVDDPIYKGIPYWPLCIYGKSRIDKPIETGRDAKIWRGW
jgi:hypothetical protein